MAESAIATAVIAICRSMFGCYPSIKNFICLEWNLRALKKEKNKLVDLKDKLKEKVDYSSDADFTKWLRDVAEALYEDDADLVGADNPNCCHVCLCYCCKRNSRSKEIAEERKKVKRLLKEGPKTAKMADREYLIEQVEPAPGPCIQNQSAASTQLAKIMDLLKKDNVKRIGVWGMGGVGKTTLVNNLNNKLKETKETKEFHIVILVPVSQLLDLKDIRKRIADRLHLELKVGESEQNLTKSIHWMLSNWKFLLILDDVRPEINLDDLGVPQLEGLTMGSKIIFTSRSLEVCKEMMTDIEEKVEVLNETESWELFAKTAEDVATSEEVEPVARTVARECGGLPLALITVGKAMRRKKERRLWEDALSELQTSRDIPDIYEMENKVFNSLKLSYDSLPDNNNIKPCFLFCCLYPAGCYINVSELVKCWLGEGLLGGYRNSETSYNRGVALIQSLKDCCLLEDGDREGTVKMHDLVRRVAISISSSSEDPYKSLIRSGMSLDLIPEPDLSATHRRLSFTHNEITSLLDIQIGSPNIPCPMSSTLLLQENQVMSIIDEGFFRAFPALKVLNISGTGISSLPVSITQLVGLLVLILRDCDNLETIQQVSQLTKLQVLDCSGSGIISLPTEMKKIKQLYLSRTRKLQTIAPGVISAMSGLEVLDMASSAYIWDAAALGELIGLKHLLVISMQLSGIPILDPKGKKWIRGLSRYQFVIGQNQTTLWETELDGKIVTLTDGVFQGVSSSPLLSDATSLVINSYTGLVDVLPRFTVKSNHFAALKFLTIVNSSMLISDASTSTSGSSSSSTVPKFDMIPNLEKLHLSNVQSLESISHLMDRLGANLSKLREIDITNCPGIKFLFANRAGLAMRNLKVIRIRLCNSIMYIWCPTPDIKAPVIVFPKLQVLEVADCDSLHSIPLSALNPETLPEIKGQESWWICLETDEARASFQPLFKELIYEVI